MDIEPWDLRDPERLITDVATRTVLKDDTVLAVLVRQPSTEQKIVAVRRLDLSARQEGFEELRDVLCDLARSFPLPDVRPPRHALVTVIVRRGRCVFGPNEGNWLSGWRYSNHFAPVYDSGLILVTEHGWADFMSQFAGHEPRLVA